MCVSLFVSILYTELKLFVFLSPPSAIRTWYPLCEAPVRLQYVFCAAVPAEHVPVSGKRQPVQLAALQPLQQQ